MLRGRRDECAVLDRLLDGAGGGRSAALVLGGEAGAGKTTALQAYAGRLLENGQSRRYVLFAQLPRVIRSWQRYGQSSPLPALEDVLSQYLRSLGREIDAQSIANALRSHGGNLILDGVDEVYGEAPWIVAALGDFAVRFGGVQIVTSSRISGSYLESLPFLAIGLVPFTAGQRAAFVSHWFAGDRELATRLLEHVADHEELAGVAGNPLLVTVLCVLTRFGVELPSGEVALYDERLRLLLGAYDLHKGVRRLHTRSSTLGMLAKGLAFRLHSAQQREETPSQMYAWASEVLQGTADTHGARRAVDELVDPANLLVRSLRGDLGFGHLRFQEHLAAQELASNRGISLVGLLRNEWWRGALELYAQMVPDLGGLVRRVLEVAPLEAVRGNLEAMIFAVGKAKQERALQALRGRGQSAAHDL